MAKKVILIWFRNDLRIHDNEILFEAVHKGNIVIPVYFFDPRYFKSNKLGLQNTGILRAKFLIESVQQLKDNLHDLGADLLVFQGKPEDILGTLCAKYEVTEVYHHREVAHRETKISERVETALWKEKINLKHFIGHTLYHKEDLPIPIKDIPDSFSAFKKKVEKESFVRPVLPTIEKIVTHPHLEVTQVPTLEDLGFSPTDIQNIYLNSDTLKGGEDNALKIIDMTLSPHHDDVDDYNLVSPFIAVGAVSPAYYYHKIKAAQVPAYKKKYEKLISRLLWRDYFRFMLKKHPNIFFKNHQPDLDIIASSKVLQHMISNGTDELVINEMFEEIKRTGNLPYEYREILAAYLTQTAAVNHLAGANLFEEFLIDYAPATTYGYWLHVAGFGTSAKDNTSSSWQDLVKKNYKVRSTAK
ncbi:deoxyribodipyrimidine photo-lyase [Sphingobacterium sp. LRF_L2]|uniref:deoxyribodipyrimidine photo-lyase n=1 Tax=Sphingobacterium sp. LRF_L2 TaxID=3369421 RepID=UPI003F636C5B